MLPSPRHGHGGTGPGGLCEHRPCPGAGRVTSLCWDMAGDRGATGQQGQNHRDLRVREG